MTGLNFGDVAGQDIRGAVQYLKQSSPKVGVSGYCMGGALTILAAVFVPEVDAAVAWYGFPPLEYVDASKIKAPLMGHLAIHASATLDVPAARKGADAATRRYKSGKPLSPIDGCPIAVKDIIATADMPTQMNSPIYKGWRPKSDAACVAALRRAGAVIIGKTVTTEFAIGRSGATRNPFDTTRT